MRAHMHALFETELQSFENAIRAIEEQDDFLPRLEASEVLCSSGEPVEYARVLQELEFSFLFFSRSYEYVLHYNLTDRLPEEELFRIWWELEEPRDDQILTTDGSLYFERVLVDGKEFTYVAYATHTVFKKERLGLRAALERFGEKDVHNAIIALAEEARRRE